MSANRPAGALRALLSAWLTIDFFGQGRREGKPGSGSLTSAVFTQGFLSYLFAALAVGEVPALRYDAGCLLFVVGLALLGAIGELRGRLGDPAERDFLLAAPISRSTLHVAHALHTALLQSLYTTGLAIAPAVLAIWVHGSVLALPLFVLFAIWTAFGVTALFEIPLLLISRLRGPEAASAASALLRGLVLGVAFIGAVLGLRAMHLGPASLPGGGAFVPWLPSVPAARAIGELVRGEGLSSAGTGLALLWPLLALLLLALLARLPERSEGQRRRAPGQGLAAWRLSGAWRRGPADLGLARFLWTMLLRERSYRLRALPLLGLPAAVALLGLEAAKEAGRLDFFLALVHALPLVYTPALLVFLPFAEHWRAHWLLELGLDDPIAASRRAAVTVFGLLHLAVQLALFALDAAQTELVGALLRTATALGLCWVLLPLLVRPLFAPLFSRDPESFATPDTIAGLLGFGLLVVVAGVGLEAAPLWVRIAAPLLLLGAGARIWRRGDYSQ